MKQVISIAFLFFLFLLILSSCQKYDDGPGISLRSKKERLANTWKVSKYLENGVDMTANYRSIVIVESLELKKDGTYSYTETSSWSWAGPDEGTWKFIESKEVYEKLSNKPGAQPEKYKILKLKEKELWIEDTDSTMVKEFHYVPVN